MKYRVVLQPEAKLDLIEAVEYLWPHAPQGAERWTLGLLNAIQSLQTNPQQYAPAAEAQFFSRPLREWFYRTKSSITRAVFIIVDDEVRVLRIRRPGQDLLKDFELP